MIDRKRIRRELVTIKKRLQAGDWKDKDHGPLYAAQQALEWVLNPEDAMAPAKMIKNLDWP